MKAKTALTPTEKGSQEREKCRKKGMQTSLPTQISPKTIPVWEMLQWLFSFSLFRTLHTIDIAVRLLPYRLSKEAEGPKASFKKERTKKPHELSDPTKLDKILFRIQSIPKLGSVCRLGVETEVNQEAAWLRRAPGPPHMINAESKGLYIAYVPTSLPRGPAAVTWGP